MVASRTTSVFAKALARAEAVLVVHGTMNTAMLNAFNAGAAVLVAHGTEASDAQMQAFDNLIDMFDLGLGLEPTAGGEAETGNPVENLAGDAATDDTAALQAVTEQPSSAPEGEPVVPLPSTVEPSGAETGAAQTAQ